MIHASTPVLSNAKRWWLSFLYWSFLGCALSGSLFAFAELNRIGNKNGYALYGYDTVAYFTQNKALRGNTEYQYEWKAVTWLFVSQTHLEKFKAEPAAYAPQYGGYCAWGLGKKNKLYRVDPTAWSIVAGKLYLNYNKGVRSLWKENIPKFITNADRAWEKLLTQEQH